MVPPGLKDGDMATRTFIAPEDNAYPHGGQTRKCLVLFPDGALRRAWCGIPDTYFSIPAHARVSGRYVAGWIGVQDDPDKPDYGEYLFHSKQLA